MYWNLGSKALTSIEIILLCFHIYMFFTIMRYVSLA